MNRDGNESDINKNLLLYFFADGWRDAVSTLLVAVIVGVVIVIRRSIRLLAG